MTDLAALLAERELPMARWNVPGPHRPRTTPRLNASDLLAEISHLWGTDSPQMIATRLGYRNPHHLARRLHRLGEHHLANHLDRKAAA